MPSGPEVEPSRIGLVPTIKETPVDPHLHPFQLVRIQQKPLAVCSLEHGLHQTPRLSPAVTLDFWSPEQKTLTSVVCGILSQQLELLGVPAYPDFSLELC